MVKMMRQFDGVHKVPAQRNHADGPADGQRRRGAVGGSSPASGGSPASDGGGPIGGNGAGLSRPEGRVLGSAGKPLSRLISDLKGRWAAALVRVRGTAAALEHAA